MLIVVKVDLVAVEWIFVFVSNKFAVVFFNLLKPSGEEKLDINSGFSGNDGDGIGLADLKIRHFRHERLSWTVIGKPVGRESDVHRGDNVTDCLRKVNAFCITLQPLHAQNQSVKRVFYHPSILLEVFS